MAPTTQGEASQMGILNRANGGNGSISLICVCVCVRAREGGRGTERISKSNRNYSAAIF